MNKMEKFIKILNALNNGVEVEIDGIIYAIIDGELCIKVFRSINGSDIEPEFHIRNDLLGSIFHDVMNITEREIFVICANSVLQKAVKEKNR